MKRKCYNPSYPVATFDYSFTSDRLRGPRLTYNASRASRNPDLKRHVEIPFVVALHLLIASALGLIAAGASALTSSNPQSSSLLLVKIGIVTLLLSWLVILGLSIISLQLPKGEHERNESQAGGSGQYRNGTIVSASL